MAQQVDEVTRLADQATTADDRILRPVRLWNLTSIDGDDEALRFGHRLQQCGDSLDVRREAAVETDHQHRCGRGSIGPQLRLDRVDLFRRDRQRLLDEYVLARPQRTEHVSGMAVVPRGHDDGVDIGTADQRLGVRGRLREAVLAAQSRGRHSAAAGDTHEPCSGLSQRRDQHAAGVVAGADDGESRLAGDGRRAQLDLAGRLGGRGFFPARVVFQDDAEIGWPPPASRS